MIDVKAIRKPKSGSAPSASGGYTVISKTADEATHAARADKATFAEQAEYAERSGVAARATYADKAGTVTDDSPVYDKFLRKDTADTAAETIAFEKGLTVGKDNGGIDGSGNATLSDVVLERVHDAHSTAAERTIIGAQGFDLYLGGDGKSHLYVDYFTARTRFFASSAEIRKVSYSGGTTLFSNAGSTIAKVASISYSGTVIGYKCYALADNGTDRTANWWHVGMMALCQTFNVKAGDTLSNRFYWRMVADVGQEVLDDGKLYDYVVLANVKTFSGGTAAIPVLTQKTLAVGSDELVWGEVAVGVDTGDGMTSVAAIFEAQEGKTVDDANVSVASRTFYGYADGSVEPQPYDVIVQAGDQIQWTTYGNLIKLSTSTEDNDGNAPAIAMYANMGMGTSPYQWQTLTTLISPGAVYINSDRFKLFTNDVSDGVNPIEHTNEKMKEAQTALLNTGIDIESQRVTITSNTFQVRNNSGETTALITSDGKLNTDIVESRVLKTYLDGGMAGVVIEAGLMKVFNPNGVCNIQFGVDENGYAVLSYFDNNGRKLYDLGPNGMDAKNQSDATLTAVAYVGAQALLKTTGFYESATYTVGGKTYTLTRTKQAYEQTLFGGGLGSQPFASASQVTLYKYVAARKDGIVIADSTRNLTQALAEDADGKFFTSETICDGSTLQNLAKTIYFLPDDTVTAAPYPVSTESFTYPAYTLRMVRFSAGERTQLWLYSHTERTVSPFVK